MKRTLALAAAGLLTLGAGALLAGGGPLARLFLAAPLLLASLTAWAVLVTALWPDRVRSRARLLRAFPLRSWLVGLLVLALQGLLLAAVPHGGVAALLLLADLLVAATVLPAVGALAGRRLGFRGPARTVAAGTALVGAASLLPVLGWLLALNLAVASLGAALLPGKAA